MTTQATQEDIDLMSRYLDGELPAGDSRSLEARLRNEPELRATLVRLEELDHLLRDALKEQDRIPAAVTALLDQEQTLDGTSDSDSNSNRDNVVRFPGRSTGTLQSQQPRWAYAMAASLAAAVGLSLVLSNNKTHTLPGNDALVTAALDTQSSGSDWAELADGRELQAVLSFPHEDGRWCREYLLRGGDSDWRAVACREDDRWVTQAAGLESFLDSTEAYRPAGASDSATVAVFISQNAADIALGADEEQRLMDKGWR